MTKREAAQILYREKSNAGWMRWNSFPVDPKKEAEYKRYIEAVDIAVELLMELMEEAPCTTT